jgi:hypothetical protein
MYWFGGPLYYYNFKLKSEKGDVVFIACFPHKKLRTCATVQYPDVQWRYSPDRALASLTGFMIVYSTLWGYQLLDTLIQPSETSNGNYQRLSWRSRETQVRNGS